MAKRDPYQHSGKLIPERTKEQVERTIETARQRVTGATVPEWKFWREKIIQLKEAELQLVETEEHREHFRNRVTLLVEAMAGIDLIEQETKDDPKAAAIAFHGVYVGTLIAKAAMRLLEASAVIGMKQSEVGLRRSDENKQQSFSITRAELLEKCKQAYKRYGCNQKELAAKVATGLPVGAERIRQLMSEHNIKKADYAK